MGKELNLKIIPKPKAKASLKANLLVWLTFVLLLLCIASAAFLVLFLNPSLSDKKEKIQEDLILIEGPANKELKERVIIAGAKISDFELLWAEHKSTVKLFDFLKEICHKRVRIRSVNLGFEDDRRTVSFEAIALDFKALGEQLLAFKQNKMINLFTISGISLTDEGVSFNLFMDVSEDIFFNPLSNK